MYFWQLFCIKEPIGKAYRNESLLPGIFFAYVFFQNEDNEVPSSS